MEKQVFDLIISLGGNCSAASQLIYRNLRDFSLPFDYCFMADDKPIKYFAEGIQNKFKNFLLKENLIELKGDERGDERETWQYKDIYTGYRFIHLFGNDINISGVYEKGLKTIKKRINRLYQKIATANNILIICATDFNFDEKNIYELKNIFEKIYPEKNFVFYTLMFRCSDDYQTHDKNTHFIYSKRAVNLYDFNKTNFEWNFLDNIKLSNKKRNRISFNLFHYKIKIEWNR